MSKRAGAEAGALQKRARVEDGEEEGTQSMVIAQDGSSLPVMLCCQHG